MTQYVIIGDGISGSSAAETLREEDPDAKITVITDEGSRCIIGFLSKNTRKANSPKPPSRSTTRSGTRTATSNSR